MVSNSRNFLHVNCRNNRALIESYCLLCHKFVAASRLETNLNVTETAHRIECKDNGRKRHFNHLPESSLEADESTSAEQVPRTLTSGKVSVRVSGCEVLLPTEENQVLELLNSGTFDCLVICYMMFHASAARAAALFKAMNPQGRVVFINAGVA